MLRIRGVLGVYIGYESYTDEPLRISKTWFRELTPPWRVSKRGWRIRLGHRAIQVGTYTKNTEEDMTALKQLGGRELPEFDPSVIGGWHGQGVQATDGGPESPEAPTVS